MKFFNIFALSILFVVMQTGALCGQESGEDPATDTNIIKETLGKIREVENLDKYISENNSLKSENKNLKSQLASLTKQVAKLTQDLATQQERLRKQLLQLPNFEVKSKLVGASKSMAVLQFGEKFVRIRKGIEMDVPVADGVWTLMKVENISTEFIQLTFPELERTIVLYD